MQVVADRLTADELGALDATAVPSRPSAIPTANP